MFPRIVPKTLYKIWVRKKKGESARIIALLRFSKYQEKKSTSLNFAEDHFAVMFLRIIWLWWRSNDVQVNARCFTDTGIDAIKTWSNSCAEIYWPILKSSQSSMQKSILICIDCARFPKLIQLNINQRTGFKSWLWGRFTIIKILSCILNLLFFSGPMCILTSASQSVMSCWIVSDSFCRLMNFRIFFLTSTFCTML